jgi:hypothetical protein
MKLFRFMLILMLISFIFSTLIYGQQKDREIKRTVWKNEPIKIVKIKVRNKAVKLKERFVEDDDWLKDFSIEVENVSSQPIIFLEIELSFPQDKDGMPPAPATELLSYGVIPLPSGISPNIKPSEPPLKPGDRATLKVVSYERLQELLNYAGHSKSIGEITIRIGRSIFADGKMWNREQIFERDPNDPRRWQLPPEQGKLKPADTLVAFSFF